MKRLVKVVVVMTGVSIIGLGLARLGMQIGAQIVEDIKTEAIEQYQIEQDEREASGRQYQIELLDPVRPVNQYILAQEGILV